VNEPVVGVDDSEHSARAVEFAAGEAVVRRTTLKLVHVLHWLEGFEDIQRRHLASVLEPLQQKYPGVTVTQQALPGTPSRMLVDSNRLVDALVIGGDARPEEKRSGMRIGALAHTILHHAHCPVIVVPEH
jgi:nucleotide-binding universal stress UspA family protein